MLIIPGIKINVDPDVLLLDVEGGPYNINEMFPSDHEKEEKEELKNEKNQKTRS